VLQKPCLVLPNEFGPADVGVSLPIFLIRILASLGISSGSSSLTSPNTAATDLDAGLGRIGGSFYKNIAQRNYSSNILKFRVHFVLKIYRTIHCY